MKTVKRKANVGERILITGASFTCGHYKDGDALTVEGREGNGVCAKGISQWVHDIEYEVIIENENGGDSVGIIEQMQAEIAELKTKVATLEGIKYTTDLPEGNGVKTWVREVYKSPQEIRDDIVAKEKRDVAELESANYMYGNSFDYVIDREKRTVVALVKITRNGKVVLRGIAKCDPSDCFNVHIGKAIALRRALGLEVPAEYFQAPAPTEARVGDVVYHDSPYGNCNRSYVVTKLIENPNSEAYPGQAFKLDADTGWLADSQVKIIDDSNE